jgi:hypothetical protein
MSLTDHQMAAGLLRPGEAAMNFFIAVNHHTDRSIAISSLLAASFLRLVKESDL